MNRQQLLDSLKGRRTDFQDMATRSDVINLGAVVRLLEQIEKDVQSLEEPPIPPIARIYISTFEKLLAISSVPNNTPMDDWEKHAVEFRPMTERGNRLSDVLTMVRNVLTEAGVETIVESE